MVLLFFSSSYYITYIRYMSSIIINKVLLDEKSSKLLRDCMAGAIITIKTLMQNKRIVPLRKMSCCGCKKGVLQ